MEVGLTVIILPVIDGSLNDLHLEKFNSEQNDELMASQSTEMDCCSSQQYFMSLYVAVNLAVQQFVAIPAQLWTFFAEIIMESKIKSNVKIFILKNG